ncbi:MAG: UPF0175 family protein [Phycisphaeraceae bacterium]
MTVSFDLPADIEQNLRRTLGDVSQVAKEAAMVELYRQSRITHVEFARALGVSRLEAEAILQRHGVIEDTPTHEDHDAALARLRTAGGA